MNTKAIARFLYANVPGAASARFAAKDLLASRFSKPEYGGISCLSIANGVIIDVGANRGQSIAAFRRFAPRCELVAFEPEPLSADRLSSFYRNDPHVTVHNCALGERSERITIFQPKYGRWNCDGMASTDRRAATEWLHDPGRMFQFNEERLSLAEYSVAAERMDSFELTPRLIKLHAQGAELEILKGAERTVQQHHPALMCAFPTGAVASLLDDWGYRPYTYKKRAFLNGLAGPPATFTWFLTDDHMQIIRQATARA